MADRRRRNDSPRVVGVLEAAVGVFARFGFRKTSMDEVARAAGISRQGLYLQYDSKEDLFRKALAYSLQSQLSAAVAVLARSDLDLAERLIAACDEWSGKFVGSLGADAADLMCAGNVLAGETLRAYANRFEEALCGAIAASALARHCKAAGVSVVEVARTLHATARGLKLSCTSRQEFVKGIGVAVRMYCAPLQARLNEGVSE